MGSWRGSTVRESGAESVLQQIGEFAVPEANQGVGVDAKHFYAVDTTICQGGTPDLRNRT
jgi:hypothetical protein